MDDLGIALIGAWRKHRSRILSDPAELQQRLARRRMGIMLESARAWCVAVRASDTRIDPFSFACVPEDAAYPASCRADRSTAHYGRHTVDLTATGLRKICGLVRIERPGEDWEDVAKKLGRSPRGLHYDRCRGLFHNHYVPHLGGKRGVDVPIIYSDRLFDPMAGDLASGPDPIWGSMVHGLADDMPDDFQQTLTRVPAYRRRGPLPLDPDRPGWPRRSHRLPPRPPDYVWYKWKNGVFHDPHVKRRHSKAKPRIPAPPRPDDLQFRGWRWICPGCKKRVRTVYYPIAPFTILKYLGEKIRVHEADEIQKAPATFACNHCHKIRYFGRGRGVDWNHLVAQLTGGLLYGHEVVKPESFKPTRRRKYRPLLNRPPSKRREQVLRLLLAGRTYQQIADELGIGHNTVNNHARRLRQQYNVHNLAQLCQRHGVRKPLPPRALEVFHRLLSGHTCRRIAAGMHRAYDTVCGHVKCVYRYYGVHSRKELIEAVAAGKGGRKGQHHAAVEADAVADGVDQSASE